MKHNKKTAARRAATSSRSFGERVAANWQAIIEHLRNLPLTEEPEVYGESANV